MGRALRGICGRLVETVLLWLALAVPGLMSNRDRTATALTHEVRR